MSQPGTGKGWPAESKVFHLADMTTRTNPNGSVSRSVGVGTLATGERVRVHQTTQPPGVPANPAHRNEHTEFLCVREGTLEFTYEGAVRRAEAGDVAFIVKGAMHSVRNVGSGPASYFVVSIGGDV